MMAYPEAYLTRAPVHFLCDDSFNGHMVKEVTQIGTSAALTTSAKEIMAGVLRSKGPSALQRSCIKAHEPRKGPQRCLIPD